MDRICPPDAFREAHNGLSLFLSQYPYMDEAQRAKIRNLIDRFSRPEIWRNKVRRQGLLCRAAPDGVLAITPHFIKSIAPS
jgi:hypothetical protein